MEWYHYVIIVSAVIILILLVVSIIDGRKEQQKEALKEKPIAVEPASTITEPMKEKAPEPEVINDVIQKYHISQNKDEKSPKFKEWRVRKEGSNKTIKYFKTQKEAIEYAERLAENKNSSIVIHKVDGSIRKQDYTKKD